MSAAGVRTSVLAEFDTAAALREAQQALVPAVDGDGKGWLWLGVDGADDQDYENARKGSRATAADVALLSGPQWASPELKATLNDLEAYCSDVLGITGAYPRVGGYLASIGSRVSDRAAENIFEALGNRLPATAVFPKGVLPADGADPSAAGLHKFGRYASSALTAADGALPATIGASGIVAINLGATQTVAATFTATRADGTTVDLALSLSTAAQYTQTRLGAQAVNTSAAAGQKTIPLAATAQFKAGEYALVWESDANSEVILVASIAANTSVAATSNLVHSYTGAAVVIPFFRSVVYKNGGSGSGNVDLFALPDRTIALPS